MTLGPRLDVSAVPLQGGYVAKKCPILIQNRILHPELEENLESPELRHRFDAGNRFEAETVGTLRVETEGEGAWLIIPDVSWEKAQELTLQGMKDGFAVIEQAFLPADHEGRRTGRPDLLVRHGKGYVPVDIKHHRVLDVAEEKSVLMCVANELSPDSAHHLEGHALRRNIGDALQLAHYRRMLEAIGFASDSMLAGILGSEGVVVWYDLTEPMWQTPAKSDGKKRKLRSTLERYDFEFGFRLDIAATALAHRKDNSIPLIVEPMHSGECGECGYRNFCSPTFDAGSGDSSLLPGLDYSKWRALRDLGIRERKDVAALHYPTGLLAETVELSTFLDLARGQSNDTPLSALRPQATKQLAALADAGIDTVGDLLDRVDPITASVGFPVAARIIDARAAIGEHPVYRRPGATGLDVPRFDIEIDVDMENINEGVYLWGTLLTDRGGSGSFEEGYRPFVSWKDMDEKVESKVFAEFWDWLNRQRTLAEKHDLSIGLYVWYSPAEHSRMKRIVTDPDLASAVTELVESKSWIDLKAVFDRSWVTGGSTSLKVIAPLSGFNWPVDDPGGGYSMVMYEQAIDGARKERETAQQWILDYNRGDVEATRQIREWLSEAGSTWTEVASD